MIMHPPWYNYSNTSSTYSVSMNSIHYKYNIISTSAMFGLSDTPCKSILRSDGKIATKLWLAMGPFQIMLMTFS